MKSFLLSMTPVLFFLFSCSNLKRLTASEIAGDYNHISGNGVDASLFLHSDGTFTYKNTQDLFSWETSGKWQLKAQKILLKSTHSIQKDSSCFMINTGEKKKDTLVVKISQGGHYSYDLYENGERIVSYGGDNEVYLPVFNCDSLVIQPWVHEPIRISLTRFDLDTLYINVVEEGVFNKVFDNETWRYKPGFLWSEKKEKFKRMN